MLREALIGAGEFPNLLLKIVRRFQTFFGFKKASKVPRKSTIGAEEVPNSILKTVGQFQTFFGLKKA